MRHEPTLSAEESSALKGILERSGLLPECYREAALARRLPACLRALRCNSIPDLLARLEAKPELLDELVNTLLIGVTDFFRDHEPWILLEKTILPELLATTPTPRILSAGCSDGAELYSFAMLLADQRRLAGATILGVDCRGRALKAAAEGLYSLQALRGVPFEMRERFFSSENRGYRISRTLRDAASWQHADACNLSLKHTFHLIACRNLAIYLDPGASERLWHHLSMSLQPGGILFVGKAERPSGPFARIAPCLFKKVAQ